jgi:hypothetical protein
VIHEIGVQLQAALHAKKCGFNVVDGPERRDTTTYSRERVVIQRAGDDAFETNHKATVNPPTRFTRLVPCKLTIYAQEPKKGPAEWEHYRRAEKVLDLCLCALYAIAKGRANRFIPRAGRFLPSPDLKDAETFGGVRYELDFIFDRGVADTKWDGTAAGTTTITDDNTGVTLANTYDVTAITEESGSQTETA